MQLSQAVAKTGRLKHAMAFWHADILSGPERGFTFAGCADVDWLADKISEGVQLFEQNERNREEFFSQVAPRQLRDAATLMHSTLTNGLFVPEKLTGDKMAHFLVWGVLNVAILEKYGRLIPDEYNGMLYVYESK